MKVKIKRFDNSVPLPTYKTAGAAGMDLSARKDTTILAREIGYIPLNIAIQLPKDHFLLMAARSSLHKRGLSLINGVGIGDYDYRGDGDEYQATVFNFADKKVVIEKGERVAQMLILPIERVELEEVDYFNESNRGGFGSTGRK